MTAKRNIPRPTDAELDILNVLWELGSGTVRQVHEALSRTKACQYTTTLKLMQIMADKGLLTRDASERSHVYTPRAGRDQVRRQLAGDLLDRVFGGSARSLLIGALGAKPASREELAELQRTLEEYEKGKLR